MRSPRFPSNPRAIAEVGQGRTTVLVLFLLLLGACQPFARRESRPREDVAGIASSTAMDAIATATAARGLDEARPGTGYPDPQAFRAPADITATAEMAAARPTLPADLPDSGPIEPAVDLARLASEPFLLAWVDDQGLWLFEEGDEAPRRLVEGQGFRRPQLDPDRRVIIWQAVDPARADDPVLWSLWSMSLDEQPGDARQILTPADMPEARGWNGLPCPRWLRDVQWLGGVGPRLAFATNAVGECGGYAQHDLWTMSLDAIEPDRLLEKEVAHFRPSPDGEWIAIVEPGAFRKDPAEPSWISVVDLNRGEIERLLAYGEYWTETDYTLYPDLRWIDNGEAILVAIESADLDDRYFYGPFDEAPTALALRLSLDGARSRIGEISGAAVMKPWQQPNRARPLVSSGMATQAPAWSPDLARLVMIEQLRPGSPVMTGSDSSRSEQTRFVVADGDGSNPEVYASGEGHGFHGWAPTVQRFLYSESTSPGEVRRLFVGAPGEAPRLLFEAKAEDEHIGMARWAGDDHVVLLREGLPTPPLLELHGLDGSSRGLAQSVGIEVDALP